MGEQLPQASFRGCAVLVALIPYSLLAASASGATLQTLKPKPSSQSREGTFALADYWIQFLHAPL